MGVPYIGLYSASKHALEGYSEALRYEVKSFGIRVALLEPGDTRSDIALNTPAPKHSISDYNGLREQVNAMHTANVANGIASASIARAIARVVDHPRPGLRYPITKGLEIFVPLARRFLPYFLIEPNIRDYYKLDG
jgi:short-subunit dehydrogenase